MVSLPMLLRQIFKAGSIMDAVDFNALDCVDQISRDINAAITENERVGRATREAHERRVREAIDDLMARMSKVT